MGGGERVAAHSILASKKNGYDVTLIAEDFNILKFQDFFGLDGLFDQVEMLTYPAFKPSPRGGLLLYQRLWYHQRRIKKLLRKTRPKLLLNTQDIAFLPYTDASTIHYCYFTEQFSHLQSAPTSAFWRLYYWPASRLYRENVRRAHRLLSVSEFTRGFIKRRWGRESTTLYPPCPVELYSDSSSDKEDLVISTGRIVPGKRFDLFMDIARHLPQYKFAIVGSLAGNACGYYEHLLREAPSNVSVVLSPLRKVREILSKAKVYVHCAEDEHFGITIVEAMAARCVPIVHDSGGPREIVDVNVGYRWNSIGEAVERISGVVEDEGLRRSLSAAASLRAKLFAAEVFEAGLSNILRQYVS